MKQLWAPWRMDFIEGAKTAGCPFCLLPQEKNDRQNLILHRSPNSFVIMNRYPYGHGHLLVIPFVHLSELEQVPPHIQSEMALTLQKAVQVLKTTLKPDGMNIGMNLGIGAGAGIPGHLHYHLIPRWIGDTNFMPLIGQTKVMNEHLETTFDKLVKGFV